MKRLILIISLLIGTLSVMAQTAGSPLGNAKSYIPLKGGFKIDSGLYLPKKFPSSYRSLDSTGLVWYDLITRHLWYHNGTARKETVPKTYVDSAVASAGGGSVAIGSPIGGSTPFHVLYVDGSSNLAQPSDISILAGAGSILQFNNGAYVGTQIAAGSMSFSTNVEDSVMQFNSYSSTYTQNGAAMTIYTPTVTGTKAQKIQNDTGYIALIHNLPTMSSFTTSGVAGVSTYTTTVASGFTISIVQSKNTNATVDYSSVSGTTLTVHADSVTAGSSNLTFIYFLK